MNQHDNPDRTPDETPQQPTSEAAPYPPPPPIFSDEPAPGAEPNTAPPPPPGGTPTGAATQTGGFHSASSGDINNPTKDERNWAMFAHLSGLIIGVIGAATTLPAWGFIGPLVIWLIKKDESPFIADQAKEALNFCITLGITMFVLWLIALILVWTIVVPFLVMIVMFVIGIAALILMIMAAVKAADGQLYRYPFTLRLIN